MAFISNLKMYSPEFTHEGFTVGGAASGPAGKMYNLSTLRELDDDEYLVEILDIFLDNTPMLMNAMKVAADNKNWIEVHKKAHTLKSSLGMLQMTAILEVVTSIESLSKSNDDPDLTSQLVSKSVACYSGVHAALEKERNEIHMQGAS